MTPKRTDELFEDITLEFKPVESSSSMANAQYAAIHLGQLILLCRGHSCCACTGHFLPSDPEAPMKALVFLDLKAYSCTPSLQFQGKTFDKYFWAHNPRDIEVNPGRNEHGLLRLPSLNFAIPRMPDDCLINLGHRDRVGASCFAVKEGNDRLVIDCGIALDKEAEDDLLFSFSGQSHGEQQLPNLKYIETWKPVGIIFTHGHRDHAGAMPDLARRLGSEARPPLLYATPLTAALLRKIFTNARRWWNTPIEASFQPGDTLTCCPFSVQTFPVYHSIPQTCGLVITTPKGKRIVHLTDFKLQGMDPSAPSLLETLKKIKQAGEVDLLVLDVMNAKSPITGQTPHEQQVVNQIEQIVNKIPPGQRVVVSLFSTNIDRMRAVIEIGGKARRKVSLYGRGMKTVYEVGQQLGLLSDLPEAPINGRLLIVTGCQAEPRSVLDRWAKGEKDDEIGRGVCTNDHIIFSSRPIPGNERVNGLIKQLKRHGAMVYCDPLRLHVSGHGHLEDMMSVIQCLQPKKVLPIHADPEAVKAFEQALVERFPSIPSAWAESDLGVAL